MVMKIGLVGVGSTNWIAGVQYHHSLLYGNGLLPENERAELHVFLDEICHRTTDYDALREYAAGVHSTDFFPGEPNPQWRRLRKFARVIAKEKRWPVWPRANLPQLVRKLGLDAIFTANGVERAVTAPQVCWLPDFQHVHLPEFFSAEERARRTAAFGEAAAAAQRVIVSNDFSRRDMERLFPQFAHKVCVLPFSMYLGDDWRKPDAPAQARAVGLPEKFLLFPSQFWKHKNHRVLFEAIRLLHARGFTDVALGCTGFFGDTRFPEYASELRAWLAEHRMENAIRILGLLPRSQQVQLIRAAAATVQPSLFEGWSGLLEDSHSLGKIVFASNIPQHVEQRTKRTVYFEARSAEALADCIAARWPELRPGPDPEAEAEGERDYHERIRRFARDFVAICRSAAA